MSQLESNPQTDHKVTSLDSIEIGKYVNESTLISEIQIETVIPQSYANIHTGIEMIVIHFQIICKISSADAFTTFFHFAGIVITGKNTQMRIDAKIVRYSNFPSESER